MPTAPPCSEDREIVASRVQDAPRDLVFRMWTEPEHVVHWWGPNGFTTTIHEMDVRPGGVWMFVMQGPDGRDYQNKIVYVEVTPPERLVYDHASGPRFHATVTFVERGDRTQVIVRMRFDTIAEREATVRQFRADEGLLPTLGRLGSYLEAIA